MATGPATRDPATSEHDSALRWLLIVETHRRMIASYMQCVARDPLEVDDLVASAIALAWESWNANDGIGCEREWLVDCCRRARSHWSKSRRADRAQVFIDIDDLPADPTEETRASSGDDSFNAELIEEELLDTVWDAARVLPQRQREAVLYRVILSWDVARTAEAMGCKHGTVKAHLHAAVRNLRAYVGERISD